MVLIVLWLVLVTNDIRHHHFHKEKIYLLRFFLLIRPLFPLRKDYFHQNNIDLQVEIIHCIQAIWRHWSREPITTLSAPLSRFIRTDYHAGQIFIPHRLNENRFRLGTDQATHRQQVPLCDAAFSIRMSISTLKGCWLLCLGRSADRVGGGWLVRRSILSCESATRFCHYI